MTQEEEDVTIEELFANQKKRDNVARQKDEDESEDSESS